MSIDKLKASMTKDYVDHMSVNLRKRLEDNKQKIMNEQREKYEDLYRKSHEIQKKVEMEFKDGLYDKIQDYSEKIDNLWEEIPDAESVKTNN